MPDTVAWPVREDMTADVLIIGSGFAGLAMAIKLLEAGFPDSLLVEKAGEIGGTWRDNIYPGCACDIPSHLYSLSFAPKADWSRMYPQQQEIQNYLCAVADRHDLRRRIRFNTVFLGATWDEQRKNWAVSTSTGRITARVLVSGMGALHIPALPALAGIEQFAGAAFHSAIWARDCVLKDKRVAVIGTGASAIQFIPRIAPVVEKLTVFQRTPAWVVPKPDRAFSAAEQKLLRNSWLRRGFRKFLFLMHELRVLPFLGNKRAQKLAAKMALKHLRRQVPDPVLRERLTPDYTMGCKRVMISDDYYPALGQGNVELVTAGVAEVRPHAILDTDGVERAVDVIIFGTGFEVTSAYRHTRIVGADGVELGAIWDRDGMLAFKGISVAGFPNYFMLLGPHTGLGHNSVVIMIEAQVGYIVSLLRAMREKRISAVDVRADAQAAFGRWLETKMAGTVWQDGGCRSWYQDKNGKVTAIWPGSAASYQRAVKEADLQDYRILTTPAQTSLEGAER
jgi:cation diffusion facilitator CzcD-associated flavoprotein CzcO